MQLFKKIFFYFSVPIFFVVIFTLPTLAAWQNPVGGTVPPNNNIDTPINVGSTNQTKSGGLNISGNVGIGTIAPGARLEIETTGANGLVIERTGSSLSSTVQFRNTAGSTYLGQYNTDFRIGASLDLGTANFLNINSTGNVGVASSSPNYLLSLDGATSGTRIGLGDGRIKGLSTPPVSNDEAASKGYVDSIVGSSLPAASGANGYTLRSNGTSWVSSNLLYNNGTNIGIGTNSIISGYRTTNRGGFYITEDSSNGYSWLAFKDGTVSPDGLFRLGSYGGKFYLDEATANNFTSYNRIISVDSNNVGIGTASPSQKLDVRGGVAISNLDDGGVSALWVTRAGGTSQGLKVYADDRNLYTRYVEDAGEPSPGTWHFINELIGGASYEFMTARSDGGVTFNAGNVGIGTSSSAVYKLGVGGNSKIHGDLYITGQINLGGGDVAEEFIPDDNYQAGTVLVMNNGGFKDVTACNKEYDSRVVGVISDQASMVMGKVSGDKRSIVALVGVIPVNVNDSSGIIKKGDLLATSAIKGEAMRAADPKIGTIIGKALEDAKPGNCQIQVLINLQ